MPLLCCLMERCVSQFVLGVNANNGFTFLGLKMRNNLLVQENFSLKFIQCFKIFFYEYYHKCYTWWSRSRNLTMERDPKWQATWRGVYPALVSESSSAPLDAKIAATLTRSSWAHKCIGASPFLALAFGSAPFLRRRLVISTWPSWAAKWRGVKPAFDSASVFAPNCRRLFAMSSWFFLAVICRGVYPFLAAAWGDAFYKTIGFKVVYVI